MSLADQKWGRAAAWIKSADVLLITAGAGMGVDSGLPDFRGNEGFWRAYPALKGYSFIEMANPQWFSTDPSRAWGFYGHRLNLYRDTQPHQGFYILKQWADEKRRQSFVFTSNVDGQFQRAGFSEDQICECHGSIHHVQTFSPSGEIYPAPSQRVELEMTTLRALAPFPTHPELNGPIRPNILMFGDGTWNSTRTEQQEERFELWLHAQRDKQLLVIEMGAGTTIPSVRHASEAALYENPHAVLIRINPREAEIPSRFRDRSISLPMGALEALSTLQKKITEGA